MSAATSKATTTNPKDLLGGKKVPLGQVLPVAMAHEACAMLDGDLKYGFRNWREKDVVANIYIDAALRHIQQWSEGEEYAEDSGVHHLGHARACLGILLDAQANDNLIDNRAKGVFGKVAEQLSAWVAKRIQKAKDAESPTPTRTFTQADKVAENGTNIAFCFTTNNPEKIYADAGAEDRLNKGLAPSDAIGPEVKRYVARINDNFLPKRSNLTDSEGGGDR